MLGEWCRQATPWRRCGSYVLQGRYGIGIGVYQLGTAAPSLNKAAAQAAFVDPGVQGRLGNADLLSQLADRPFIGLAYNRRLAAPIFGRDDTGLDQQMMNHGCVECISALGWSPTFLIEDISDLGEAAAIAP